MILIASNGHFFIQIPTLYKVLFIIIDHNKCNKQFKYKSELEKHKNKKKPCNAKIENYDCDICGSNFNYKSLLERHLNGPVHKKNYNTQIANTINNNNVINISI